MKRPFIIGVMGGTLVGPNDYDEAYQLGAQIAQRGWAAKYNRYDVLGYFP